MRTAIILHLVGNVQDTRAYLRCAPQGAQHSKNNPSQSNGRSHQVNTKAVTQDTGYTAGYSSSSAATFRKQNPCFFLPFSPACATRTSILPAGKQFCYVVHLQCRDAEKQHLFCSLSSLHTTSNLQCFRKIEGLIQKDANSVISTCKRPPCGHFQISGLSSFTYTHLL